MAQIAKRLGFGLSAPAQVVFFLYRVFLAFVPSGGQPLRIRDENLFG
jgi:hypothetical protein